MRFDFLAYYFTAQAMGAILRGDYETAHVMATAAAIDWTPTRASAIRGVVDFNTDRS